VEESRELRAASGHIEWSILIIFSEFFYL